MLPRPKPAQTEPPYRAPDGQAKFDPERTQPVQPFAPALQPPNFAQNKTVASFDPPPTVASLPIQQAIPLNGEDVEIMTHVQKRSPEIYRLEIWRNGVRQNVVPIYQSEISVGRGSKSKPVDISLAGDPEISRRHLLIVTDNSNNYWVINEGRNPAMINNYELPSGQRVPLKPGVTLAVCSYVLRIQPR